MIKLPFSQEEHIQIFPLPLPRKKCVLPFDSVLERDPKNIFYYQCDVENYTNQVLSFFIHTIDMNNYTHNLPVCNSGQHTYVTGLFKFFFVFSLIDRIDNYFQHGHKK